MTNEEILQQRINLYNKQEGARVGDFLKLRNGEYLRFSHNWGDSLQTSKGGSFYLGKSYCEFSGGLYGSIDRSKLFNTNELKNGSIWFFNNNEMKANNGVYFDPEFRVFEFLNEDEEKQYIEYNF